MSHLPREHVQQAMQISHCSAHGLEQSHKHLRCCLAIQIHLSESMNSQTQNLGMTRTGCRLHYTSNVTETRLDVGGGPDRTEPLPAGVVPELGELQHQPSACTLLSVLGGTSHCLTPEPQRDTRGQSDSTLPTPSQFQSFTC